MSGCGPPWKHCWREKNRSSRLLSDVECQMEKPTQRRSGNSMEFCRALIAGSSGRISSTVKMRSEEQCSWTKSRKACFPILWRKTGRSCMKMRSLFFGKNKGNSAVRRKKRGMVPQLRQMGKWNCSLLKHKYR